eukprot:1772006-Amphidinium_carterae.1
MSLLAATVPSMPVGDALPHPVLPVSASRFPFQVHQSSLIPRLRSVRFNGGNSSRREGSAQPPNGVHLLPSGYA